MRVSKNNRTPRRVPPPQNQPQPTRTGNPSGASGAVRQPAKKRPARHPIGQASDRRAAPVPPASKSYVRKKRPASRPATGNAPARSKSQAQSKSQAPSAPLPSSVSLEQLAQDKPEPTAPKKERKGIARLILGPVLPDRDFASDDERKAYSKAILPRKIVAGIVTAVLLVVVSVFVYNRFINPKIDMVPDSISGTTSLEEFQEKINTADYDGLSELNKGSYLGQEDDYAHSSKDRQAFVEAVYGTIDYKPRQVEQKTIYGDVVKKDGQPVMVESQTMNGEELDLQIIDWNAIKFNSAEVQAFLAERKVDINDPDIQVKLTDSFAAYIASKSGSGESASTQESAPASDAGGSEDLNPSLGTTDSTASSGLPVTTIPWVPSLESYDVTDPEDGKSTIEGKRVTLEEDGKLDNALFGSKAFLDAQMRFSEAATGEKASEDWINYVRPSKGADAKPRPPVGNSKFIQPTWIGAYPLQVGIVNEGKQFDIVIEKIIPPVGDGTKESPAGMNTSVVSSVYAGDKAHPVRVELVTFRRDQEAFDFFQSKDTKNRGFTTESQVKYAAVQFKVTNISKAEITITDNSTMSDDQANVTKPTGSMFGLTSSVKLKPGQVAIIDSWMASPNLDEGYLIWGKDFNRRTDPVWFRVLSAEDGTVAKSSGSMASEEGGTEMVEQAGSSDSASDSGGAE